MGDLHLACWCEPIPITTAAAHVTDLENTGTDRYHFHSASARIVLGNQSGASLEWTTNTGPDRAVASWSVGSLGPGMTGRWPHDLQRVPRGTAQGHTIKTAVAFASDADQDPLDDDPQSFPHHLVCKVDVPVR